MNQRLEASIDVYVSAAQAYECLTRLEDLPRFMRHVESVRGRFGRSPNWRAWIACKGVDCLAEIVEEKANGRITWRCTTGIRHSGVVGLRPLTDNKCRVVVQLRYDTEDSGAGKQDGPRTLLADIEDDMRSFANFVEASQAGT